MNNSTEDKFQLAVEAIKNINFELTNDQKLDLYKYFKQGTIGDCNIEEPYFFKLKEHAKWNAWMSVEGLDRNQALLNYINLVNTIIK